MSNRQPFSWDKLSLKQAVYLLSTIRLLASEDFKLLKPVSIVERKLAPTNAYQFDIIKGLYQSNLLYLHPDSNIEAFNFNENNTEIESFYPHSVTWALPTPEHQVIEKLEDTFQNMNWKDDWNEEILPLWREIALHECLEYLDFTMKDHGFDFKPGDKTNLTINNILYDFSVSQIFSFIWSAAKSAASFYMREKPSKQHAANSVVGTMQRNAERAKAEQWDVKHYRRDRRCPQTMISEVFFNAVLQIGEEGFNTPPH